MLYRKLTGFILNIRAHSEYDRVIAVFSREMGLVRIIAKGIRRIRSHRGFHMDLFNYVQMEVEEGKSGGRARYLREVATLEPSTGLKNNPKSFSAACVIAFFLLRIVPEETPQRELLALTKKTFESLESGNDEKRALMSFFLKATRLLGFLPNSLPRNRVRDELFKTLNDLNPQFTLYARRTLGIFSNL